MACANNDEHPVFGRIDDSVNILQYPQIPVVPAGFHVGPEVIALAANAKFEAVNKILPMPDFYALRAVEI